MTTSRQGRRALRRRPAEATLHGKSSSVIDVDGDRATVRAHDIAPVALTDVVPRAL